MDDLYAPATRELPEWGLRAEFRVEGLEDMSGENINDSGAYLWLTTDQVRFYPLDAPGLLAQAGTGDYRTDWGTLAPGTPATCPSRATGRCP
ncbi:hypothetical protein ABZ419_07265 [Streptomyces cinnamoneus]|uniref:hypothetical protein n=1 Tax=Streptomyces cinnamoneus TaxID=53446 RepID=UPI0033F6161B